MLDLKHLEVNHNYANGYIVCFESRYGEYGARAALHRAIGKLPQEALNDTGLDIKVLPYRDGHCHCQTQKGYVLVKWGGM